jgi:2-iminobutanoate/2-iminopropanoate deaminase
MKQDTEMSNKPGLPLSPVRKAGDLVFVSGQLALRDGQIVGNDVATQTSLAIDAIERLLSTEGLDLGDVVKTSVWLTSADLFPAFNGAYSERFTSPYPARSTVISGLALADALVEIDAIAQIRPAA